MQRSTLGPGARRRSPHVSFVVLAASTTLIAGVAARAGGITGVHASAAGSCDRAWVVDLRPKRRMAVVEVDRGRVWVGGEGNTILRRDGRRWSTTRVQGVGNVADIALDGPSVWVVGTTDRVYGDLVFHWTAGRWQRVRVGGLPRARQGLAFSAVDVRATDVWLAGKYDNSGGNVYGSGWLISRLHANRWQTTIGPARYAGLAAIDVLGGGDAWSVGYQEGTQLAFVRELRLHWNGSKWVDTSDDDLVVAYLYDVLALADDDAWAVGDTARNGSTDDPRTPAIEHWNGSGWSRFTVPGARWRQAPFLYAIAGFGERDVWAGGRTPTGSPALLHWDGVRWREAKPPPVTKAISDLAAAPDGTLWAVGEGFVAHSRCA